MNQTTPQTKDFARRLMALETSGNKSSGTKAQPAFYVCEKLRPHLSTLMGKAGFQALLSHALASARKEVACLGALQVTADGTLEGLDELKARVDPELIDEGMVALVAQLLGLLMMFIGEGLTLRLVGEVWPKVSLNDLGLGKGDKNEKTK